jgi:hypothetical protein
MSTKVMEAAHHPSPVVQARAPRTSSTPIASLMWARRRGSTQPSLGKVRNWSPVLSKEQLAKYLKVDSPQSTETPQSDRTPQSADIIRPEDVPLPPETPPYDPPQETPSREEVPLPAENPRLVLSPRPKIFEPVQQPAQRHFLDPE